MQIQPRLEAIASSPILPATQGMLAWTLTNNPSPPRSCKEAGCILSSDLGEKYQAGWLRGLRSSWVFLFLFCLCPPPGETHPISFQVFFSHLQNGNPFPSRTTDDPCGACLLVMLRTLGTYKYFLTRAGIFPLAIRLEEVCGVSSAHL